MLSAVKEKRLTEEEGSSGMGYTKTVRVTAPSEKSCATRERGIHGALYVQ